MHLLAPLAAGVKGAENGTAEIYKRGTSTRATWYADFEATVGDSSGSDLLLDANGGTIAYVAEYVTVTVKAADGSAVREFVAGATDNNVEVISPSFTGTDYATAASEANKPVSLATILDLWKTNAGSIDWKVLVDGSSETIKDAFASLAGIFYNVKATAYGAKGDGASDDKTAIDAAIAAADAAGGGIVFFPAGTYRISAPISLKTSVTLLGAGSGESVIEIDHATNDAIDVSAGSQGDTAIIRWLGIVAGQSNSGILVDVNSVGILVDGCVLGDTNTIGTCLDVASSPVAIVVKDTKFHFGGTAGKAINMTSVGALMSVRGCNIKPPTTTVYTGSMVTMDGAVVSIIGNTFIGAGATAGSHTCIVVNARTSIVGNFFLAPSGGACTAIDVDNVSSGEFVHEDANWFGSSVVKYELTTGTDEEKVRLGSRVLDYAEVIDNNATVTVDPHLFETVLVQRTTTAGTVTINATSVCPLGSNFYLVLWNNGTGGTVTMAWGTNFNAGTAAIPTIADNKIQIHHFKAVKSASGASEYFLVGTPEDLTE